jgi:hypothetical protein
VPIRLRTPDGLGRTYLLLSKGKTRLPSEVLSSTPLVNDADEIEPHPLETEDACRHSIRIDRKLAQIAVASGWLLYHLQSSNKLRRHSQIWPSIRSTRRTETLSRVSGGRPALIVRMRTRMFADAGGAGTET